MALKILDFGGWGLRQGFPVCLNCLRTCSIDKADLKFRDMHGQQPCLFFAGEEQGFDISDEHVIISASQVLGPQASSIMPGCNGSFVFSWLEAA